MSGWIRRTGDWLDHRAGVRGIVREALYESIPGGARWRYVWGSTLVMAFVTQAITGIFLWMAYSPSTITAWESVYYIEYGMPGGWLLRGIHHFMAQAMVVLLALHFVQVVWDGAYRAPRELNYVIGLVLMLIVLGLSLTGYLLPWDQKGYWATTVGTNLTGQAPLAGPELAKLTIGGPDYGHHTLTRFFALHAGVLPGLLVVLLVAHLALFRRHGLYAKQPYKKADSTFWPDQILRDSVASLAVLAAVLVLTIWKGAELTAPADPANPYDAARPEWYFLFLFQFLKYFPGELEVWGAFAVPGIILLLLFLMPWIGRSRAGHLLNVACMVVLLGGAVLLTVQALHDDYFALWHEKTEANAARYEASENFLAAKRGAEREAERVIELAAQPGNIPPTGALAMMQTDPVLQGPRLFARYCANCHNYQDLDNPDAATNIVTEAPTAPNLFGLGTREWVASFLDPEQVTSVHRFGYHGSPFDDEEHYGMVQWVQSTIGDVDEEERAEQAEQLEKVIAALAAESNLVAEYSDAELEMIEEGTRIIKEEIGCTDCHKFQDVDYYGGAPDLTGYMSREWLLDFISNPADARFYGENNDRMPAFAPHDDAEHFLIDKESLELLVDWLRGGM